ncbi:hypothetical protein BOX15_Mlig022782g2 [Macrostomum lignano]|uniref:RWD domain-containing protein n=1 Tax=Macrostomum lignano TaxID=282301 RepID=A0A267FXK2_9PLAT|nr:hypothetical protein BOX15_Mlig022782g2 [Macrostomum lignano]
MEEVLLTQEQMEEKDVLLSIYDGDECFTVLADNHYQYKFETDDASKSLLLDIRWGPNYPSEAPLISLDAFYNRHIAAADKAVLTTAVAKEAENWLGAPMTFTLFQHVKDNLAELTANFQSPQAQQSAAAAAAAPSVVSASSAKQQQAAGKQEQMTKSQKRRLYDRLDNKGELPRGWDWVDVIRHLSQTGSQQQ